MAMGLQTSRLTLALRVGAVADRPAQRREVRMGRQ